MSWVMGHGLMGHDYRTVNLSCYIGSNEHSLFTFQFWTIWYLSFQKSKIQFSEKVHEFILSHHVRKKVNIVKANDMPAALSSFYLYIYIFYQIHLLPIKYSQNRLIFR